MNILFLTMTDISTIDCRYIYTELIKVFISNNHQVCIVSPDYGVTSRLFRLYNKPNYKLLKVRIMKGGKNNVIKKAVNTVMLDKLYLYAIKKYFKDKKFDLILYSTPPITLASVVKCIKNRDNSKTYLMLKDIFPQNAVDLGMMSTKGLKKLIHSYFRKKEKELYRISDFIGCMSEANIGYLLKHNPEIKLSKVGLCVNSILPLDYTTINKQELRNKYSLPQDKILFFYGGNFGGPQGIDYLVNVLRDNINKQDRFFVLCGNGTDLYKVKDFIEESKPTNIRLIEGLPKKEYDSLLCACDVGMLFLDYRFTIPNFPSRMLPYMEYGIPILAATDKNTDVSLKIQEGKFGWWCESKSISEFTQILKNICTRPEVIAIRGLNARRYLEKYYTAEISYQQIMRGIQKIEDY